MKAVSFDEDKPASCQFCQGLSRQVRTMLVELRKQLHKKRIDIDDENWNQSPSKKNKSHLEAFSRLFHVLVGHKGETNCRHDKIYNKYFRKIGGSHKLIAQYFEQVSESLGFKNYQLDLLTFEIDQIGQRIGKIFEKQYNPTISCLKIASSTGRKLEKNGKPKSESRMEDGNEQKESKVKIQDKPEQPQIKIESPSATKGLFGAQGPQNSGFYIIPFYFPHPTTTSFFPNTHNSGSQNQN